MPEPERALLFSLLTSLASEVHPIPSWLTHFHTAVVLGIAESRAGCKQPEMLFVLRLTFLLQRAAKRPQEKKVSLTGLSLAFCVVTLFSVSRRSLCEAPFKCPDEAGSMPIANAVGNLFHTHMAAREEARCSLKLLFV